MQVRLTEPNIKRIIELLKASKKTQDKYLANYLEQFLKTQCTYSNLDLDEIPF